MAATVARDTSAAVVAAAPSRRIAWWELAAVASAMAVVAIVGIVALRRGAPLLWDEAVYSLRALDWIGESVRGHYWIEVRAPGLPLLLTPTALVVGATDAAFRATALGFAVAGIGVTWVIARRLTDPAVAAVTAWLLATAPGWHDSSWQVMPDIPGTVLALAAMAAILLAARGDRLSWWALAAAPLAFAATMVRFGAPLLIGPTIVAALALSRPAVRAAPTRAAAALIAPAVAAAAVWFIPQVTRSPQPPVFIYGGRQDDKAIAAAESAADFIASLGHVVGPVFGTLVLVGGVAAVVAVRDDRRWRGPVLAAALIALSVLAAMLFGIAEYHPRYLAPSLPFLALLAAVGLTWIGRRLPFRVAVALVALLGVVGVVTATRTAIERSDHLVAIGGGTTAAYAYVDERTDGPCVLLDRSARSEWYSHCAALRPIDTARSIRRLSRRGVADDEPMYAIIRRAPSRPNLQGEEAAVLDELALNRVEVSPRVTVVDVGTYGRFVQALRERGLLEQR